MPPTPTDSGAGPDMISMSAAMSNQERTVRLEMLFRSKAAIEGEIAVHLGEVERSQSFRDEGATSTESWVAERFGVATSTARSLTLVGQKAWDLPHLIGAVYAGDVSLDKVKVLAEVATSESEEELCEEAKRHSLRELADIARTTTTRRSTNPAALTSAEQHVRRFVRFNDQFRTVTAQLPAESYSEAKACLEARAKAVPTEEGARWDHRLCDGFMGVMRSSAYGGSDQAMTPSPHMVVVHVPLRALVGEASAGHGGSTESTALAGELEHDGLISTEVVQRIACDATIAVAVDDDVGRTMYEGRAQRFPTSVQRREVRRRDRHCRFPGCSHVTFANVHHVVPWKPGGRTDLPNLVFLCEYHHHLVHSKGWSMTGNANEELTIVGPTGRVMTSRPSPLWTRVTDRRRAGEAV